MAEGRDETPVESVGQLVAYLEAGSKPKAQWRIGTEHEKFGYCRDSLKPLPYFGERSVSRLLEGFRECCAWEPVFEGDNVIALKKGGESISLEPGGQFELSGAPLENLHQTCAEVHAHLAQVQELSDKMNVGFLGLGFAPEWRREDMPVMPKGRYDIMRAYMPKKGKLGLDMMLRTATVQVNLDFSSEADMVRKYRVSLAFQPVATALFANSPFREGKPNGFLSYRSHIWSDTDPDRTGMLPFVFEDGFGFARYTEYVLDVPMYFIYRDGKYIDCAGESFRAFLEGKLPQAPGELPTMADWEDHLSTVFPEVRLKRFLEMRGADGGKWARLCALPAFWVGLLYDDAALAAAEAIAAKLSVDELSTMRDTAPKLALKTPFGSGSLRDLARDLLAIARDGLKARGAPGRVSADETEFLDTLDEIVESGVTPAEDLLDRYHNSWGGDIKRIYAEESY